MCDGKTHKPMRTTKAVNDSFRFIEWRKHGMKHQLKKENVGTKIANKTHNGRSTCKSISLHYYHCMRLWRSNDVQFIAIEIDAANNFRWLSIPFRWRLNICLYRHVFFFSFSWVFSLFIWLTQLDSESFSRTNDGLN